jgi:hypothetical protein
MEKSITIHCNKLYVGDPCYVLKGKEYDSICAGDSMAAVEELGISHRVPGGDGTIGDETGRCYDIESGQIAVVSGNKADLELPKNASFWAKVFYDSMTIIDVDTGVAEVTMIEEDGSLTIYVSDGNSRIFDASFDI